MPHHKWWIPYHFVVVSKLNYAKESDYPSHNFAFGFTLMTTVGYGDMKTSPDFMASRILYVHSTKLINLSSCTSRPASVCKTLKCQTPLALCKSIFCLYSGLARYTLTCRTTSGANNWLRRVDIAIQLHGWLARSHFHLSDFALKGMILAWWWNHTIETFMMLRDTLMIFVHFACPGDTFCILFNSWDSRDWCEQPWRSCSCAKAD